MTSLPPTALETVLRRDRAVVLVSLVAVTALAWLYLVKLALDMGEGDMSWMGMAAVGAAMTASPMPWDATTFVLMYLMWAIMMVGMMLPSASPVLLLFARVVRHKALARSPLLRTAAFASGYLLAWTVFSLVAVTLQWGLSRVALVSPMMVSTSAVLGGVLFVLAGVYQLSPLKQACLKHCRAPAHFIASHWRRGNGGALRMGLEHGAFCVGCCWFLMGLLFVGGVMNLAWVAAIAVFVLLEKVAPYPRIVGPMTAVGLITAGTFTLAGAT